MNKESAQAEKLSEREIDDLVIQEASDETAWEAPVKVKPSLRTSFSLPGDLAARAAFLARIHHTKHVEEWLTRVIRERIELEEVAFAQAKREISEVSSI